MVTECVLPLHFAGKVYGITVLCSTYDMWVHMKYSGTKGRL